MVASANGDLYTPFPQGMILEEGPQSSEEGSGLHSPVFGAPFPRPHGDSSIRYQHDQPDVQHAAGILAAQFDYTAPTLNVQQPPLLNTTLEIPSPGAHHQHVTYPSDFSLPPRNQLGLDFPGQSPATSRLPPPPAHGGGGPVDFSFNSSSQRPLPGGQSHDQSYPRPSGNPPGMPMDGDHRTSISSAERTESSTSNVASGSRESRKEISTVVIACRQCRARKIRCDSTRPVCNNCVRRSNECQYDAVPKRRGPDKRPGTRQRSCKKRPADGSAPPPPKRKRTTTDRQSDDRESVPSRVKENMASGKRSSPPLSRHLDRGQDIHASGQVPHAPPSQTDLRISTDLGLVMKHDSSPTSRRHPTYGYEHGGFVRPFPRPLDVNILQSPDTTHHKFPIPSSPSVEYNQKVWWDNFIATYPLQDIADDLSYLFNDTGYWLSFLNLTFFLQTLFNPEERLRIQPSFILAGLAMATLMKSSETEHASSGRNRAIWLRDTAQAALESAWASEWIDAQLAEAALILALFESSAHPLHHPDRVASSLELLDSIIHTIHLTSVDINDPDVSRFPARTVPVVVTDSPNDHHHDRKCSCIPPDATQTPDSYSSWSYPLPWDSSWSPVQVRDEECRRLCWSALSLVASYTSQCAAFNREPPTLFLTDPVNFSILFPGEALDRVSPSYRSSDSLSPKESVWALYCRSMLLWSFCNRLRQDRCTDEDKAEYALEAWAETQAIQDSLDTHGCNLDTALIYMCREYLYNTRMTITQSLRRLVPSPDNGSTTPGPVFNRKQAEDWLFYQDQVIKRVKISIHHLPERQGHQLTRRPFQVTWFSSQLAICLLLWNHDNTLMNALELAKSILAPVDVLNALWPCTFQQQQCDLLREKLINACTSVGLDPPLLPSYHLPPLLSPS